MKIHRRDRRRWFAVHFGRSYFKSAPMASPSVGLALGIPCLILMIFAILAFLPHPVGGLALASVPLMIFAGPAPTNEKIRELRDQLLELNDRAQTVQAAADAEKRPLTEDEQAEIKNIFTQFDAIEEEIGRRELIDEQTVRLSQTQGRKAEPQQPEDVQTSTAIAQPVQPKPQSQRAVRAYSTEDRGKWGWRNFGEFAMGVRAASAKGVLNLDPRLVANAPTSYSAEGVGEDGGYALPPDWRTEIWQKVAGEDSLISLTDQNPTSRNTIVFPADETTPWDSTGGIQAYFESEAGQMSQSKVALKEKTIRLNKLTALVPVTEELLEDAPGLDAYLRKKVAEKFNFKLNLKLVQGTGAGEPLGILNSGSLVSVSKEASQPADTIVAENVLKIYSRLYAPLRRNAVWLINQDIEPQLWGMTIRVKNAAGSDYVGGGPVYMPPNGLSESPYATLLGRPVMPTQACETLGDKGDIIFVDLKQYLVAVKSGGIRADVSMHLWFDYAVQAYRFILRIAGMPWWSNYITPRDGANYPSWAVTLDERG